MSNETQAAPAAQPEMSAVQVLEAAMKASEAQAAPDLLTSHADPGQAVEALAERARAESGEAKPEEKKNDLFASKFAALSRKEKQLRDRERSMNDRIRQMEDKLKSIEEKEKQFNSFDEQLKADPLSVLEKKGLSYKDLTEKFILKPEDTPEQKQNSIITELQTQIKSLMDRIEHKDQQEKKSAEQAQQQRVEQAKQDYLKQLTGHVNEAGDKYELIRQNDAVNVVYEVMEEAYASLLQEKGEGYQLSQEEIAKLRDEAADAVETHLLEEAKKLVESNKLKSLLGSVPPKQEPTKKQPVTLSNNLSQQVPSVPGESLSDDESKRRVAAMLKWHE
jgi:hypothetical protein